jgi:hypothetical protein
MSQMYLVSENPIIPLPIELQCNITARFERFHQFHYVKIGNFDFVMFGGHNIFFGTENTI